MRTLYILLVVYNISFTVQALSGGKGQNDDRRVSLEMKKKNKTKTKKQKKIRQPIRIEL